ncbi:hypothetical protein DMUE_5791, partial [Dictyocoela muelleri]
HTNDNGFHKTKNFIEKIQDLEIKFNGTEITQKGYFNFTPIISKIKHFFVKKQEKYLFSINRGNLTPNEVLFEISEIRDSLSNIFKGCKKLIENADFIEGKGDYKEMEFILSWKYGFTAVLQIIGSDIDAELMINYLREFK